MYSRRGFSQGLASVAFAGLALSGCSTLRKLPEYARRNPGYRTAEMVDAPGYGSPVHRPEKPLIDLPESFDYSVVSEVGQELDEGGGAVPGKLDGMGAFDLGDGRVALVRNHEIKSAGGTTTIVYDYERMERVSHCRSLTRTSRNCAGGATPWGTWLSCEEDVTQGDRHGWVYQVPARHDGLVEREPLRQLGRFNHEAAAVDPATNIVYMTEDRIDGLFYRFVPSGGSRLTPGVEGVLQALAFADESLGTDSRNWSAPLWRPNDSRDVRWVTLGDSRSSAPVHGLRHVGRERRAVRFACGEGIHFGNGELYFTATSGGAIKSGQIFRYRPAEERIDLFLESTDPRDFNFGDNLTVAPNGDLIVCEDAYVGGEGNYWARKLSGAVGVAPGCGLRGVTPEGLVYRLGWLPGKSELAGACFSPDGRILFLNIYDRATLAITGPPDWQTPRPGWSIPCAEGLPS